MDSGAPEPGKSFEEETVNWSLTGEEVRRMKKRVVEGE